MLLEPEPHIPDIPDVASIPELVAVPDVDETLDDDDIPDIVVPGISDRAVVDISDIVVPAVSPVAGNSPPAVMPPPS